MTERQPASALGRSELSELPITAGLSKNPFRVRFGDNLMQ